MFKKLIVAGAAALISVCAFAQRPVLTAITDIEEDPTNGLEMSRCLFNEYFLADLTTHAKVTVKDTATIQKKIAALNIQRGQKLSAGDIKRICDSTGTRALCLVSMKRTSKGKATEVTIRIVSADNKYLGTCKGVMNNIGEANALSASLANQAATYIRALNGTQHLGKAVDKMTAKSPVLPSKITKE